MHEMSQPLPCFPKTKQDNQNILTTPHLKFLLTVHEKAVALKTETNVSLSDICMKRPSLGGPMRLACMENSILEAVSSNGVYPSQASLEADLTSTSVILDKVNAGGGAKVTSGIFGTELNLNSVLGGVNRSQDLKVEAANAFKINFILSVNLSAREESTKEIMGRQ